MNRHSLFSCPAVLASKSGGFTLIELLTVIAIILVLAGLLLNVAGNANYKSSFARANAEVKAMETALESYKADNGAYPQPASAGSGSDALNAQSDSDPSSAIYTAAGQQLYQALSGLPSSGTTYTKRYMEFKPGQLSTGSTAPSTSTYVIDPFGLAYGYSTINAYTVQSGQDASGKGFNPTFDLWSTGGYGSAGKSYSKTGLAASAYNTLWAKNW